MSQSDDEVDDDGHADGHAPLMGWAGAESRVKLRLYRREGLPQNGLVSWPVADDLVAVLVHGRGGRLDPVRDEVRAGWGGVEDGEVFRSALENVARGDAPMVEDLRFQDVVPGRALYGDSAYTATHALHLARFVDPPPLGLLLGLPHRHAVLLHRIAGVNVLVAMETLLQMIHGMHEAGPAPLSDQLYWWHEGEIVRLPSSKRNGTVELRPPPAFVEKVLAPLTRD